MASQGGAASSTGPARHERFSEPPKFIPVAFVSTIIVGLYLIYCLFHILPMLQLDVDEKLVNDKMRQRAIIECIIFHYVTFMLVICYLRSILTHPGEIPDKEQDAYWEYVPQDGRVSAAGADGQHPALQESKRSGERRYCKWCAKYKPDRCHHCRVCRTCILKMDHHCPWIYNCVGFKNHKYFFLLLFYSVLACHIIMWTMTETMKDSFEKETSFLKMFLVLFGETLATFLGVLVTAFFGFHIWLMMKAMTTIEFCEKSMKKTGFNGSTYDQGCLGNIQAVLGPNPLLWLWPCSPPTGDGLEFNSEKSRLAASLEPNRGGIRKVGHKKMGRNKFGASSRDEAEQFVQQGSPSDSDWADPERGPVWRPSL